MTQEFVTLPREVAQQALEALEEADLLMEHRQNVELRRSALVTLRAALEQSQGEQEPVAWIRTEWSSRNVTFDGPPAVPSVRDELTKPAWTPLYTRPQREREPLSLAQIAEVFGWKPGYLPTPEQVHDARAIEAAHNIK